MKEGDSVLSEQTKVDMLEEELEIKDKFIKILCASLILNTMIVNIVPIIFHLIHN
jgi:hypothetical protein